MKSAAGLRIVGGVMMLIALLALTLLGIGAFDFQRSVLVWLFGPLLLALGAVLYGFAVFKREKRG